MAEKIDNEEIIWFVYDGECPICVGFSKIYRVKKAVGDFQVLDARKDVNHFVMREINSRGLNLNEGMVIKFKNNFYHGSDALHLMALLGSNYGFLNRFNSYLFRSKFLSKLFYPLFRSLRNFALFCKGVGKIS